MMPRRDPDKYSEPPGHSGPAAISVSLATEAALLEARLRMLREAIDTVDARIEEVSEALRLLKEADSRTDDRCRYRVCDEQWQ